MTSRYYCGDLPLEPGSEIDLPREESQHLLKIMRGRVGDNILVFGRNGQFHAELIAGSGGTATVRLGSFVPGPKSAAVEMTFVIPWIKGGKTDLLLQKLTELGAHHIVIFQARREVARGDDSKIDRMCRIVVEACKQCERVDVPEITTAGSLMAALQSQDGFSAANRYLLHERKGSTSLSSAIKVLPIIPSRVLFASGPEGGWHPDEVEAVVDDVTLITLGPRILRAETAPIAAAAAMLALSGDI